jgi:hypothetical protein
MRQLQHAVVLRVGAADAVPFVGDGRVEHKVRLCIRVAEVVHDLDVSVPLTGAGRDPMLVLSARKLLWP